MVFEFAHLRLTLSRPGEPLLVYAWFSECLGTRDLKEAKGLLEELPVKVC